MSWFSDWFKSASAGSSPPTASVSEHVVNAAPESGFTPDAAPSSSTIPQEDHSDQALNELLREFQVEADKEKERRIRAREAGDPTSVAIPDDISPESLYPTEMSCRSALDYAMFCQSFGGQFVNVYRYGKFRSCSNHWSDFWLCMRTRNWDEKEKKKAIQDHYKQKAIQWKTGPSSEDVWEVRTEPVKDAFQENLEELEARVAAWKEANPSAPDPWARQQDNSS